MPARPKSKLTPNAKAAAASQAKASTAAASAAASATSAAAKATQAQTNATEKFFTTFWDSTSNKPNLEQLPTLLSSNANVKILAASFEQPEHRIKAAQITSLLFDRPDFSPTTKSFSPDLQRVYSQSLFKSIYAQLQLRDESLGEIVIAPLIIAMRKLGRATNPSQACLNQLVQMYRSPIFLDSLYWWYINGSEPVQYEVACILVPLSAIPDIADQLIDRGFYDYQIYHKIVTAVNNNPLSDIIFKINSLSLVIKALKRKPCKDMMEWIPFVLDIAEQTSDGRHRNLCLDITLEVDTAARKSNPLDKRWSKLILANDNGKRFITLCSIPDEQGVVSCSGALALHHLLKYAFAGVQYSLDNLANDPLFSKKEVLEQLHVAWESGMEKSFIFMCKNIERAVDLQADGFFPLCNIFLHYAPTKYLEIYPDFFKSTVHKAFDLADKHFSVFCLPLLAYLAAGTDFTPDLQRLGYISKSPIITRAYNTIANWMIKLFNHVRAMCTAGLPPSVPMDISTLDGPVQFFFNAMGFCQSMEYPPNEEIPYEVIEMLVELGADVPFREMFDGMTKTLERSVKYPQLNLFQTIIGQKGVKEIAHCSQQLLRDLKVLNEVVSLSPDDEDGIEKWSKTIMSKRYSQAVVKYLPQLRLRVLELFPASDTGMRFDNRANAIKAEEADTIYED